jgi:hypothetical protein
MNVVDQRFLNAIATHGAYWALDQKAVTGIVAELNAETYASHLARAKANSKPEVEQTAAGNIAMIYVEGVLTKKGASLSAQSSTILIRQAVRDAIADDTKTGIVLVFDSPGGAIFGTHELAEDIAAGNLIKPIYAYVDGVCASAAYWIASQCREIWAGPNSVVGSVGVYTVVVDSSAQAIMAGVKVNLIASGEYKGAGQPGTEVSDNHVAAIHAEILPIFNNFKEAIAIGRKLDPATVDGLADGRCWVGEQGVSVGLVDVIAPLETLLGAIVSTEGNTSLQNDLDEGLDQYMAKQSLLEQALTLMGINKPAVSATTEAPTVDVDSLKAELAQAKIEAATSKATGFIAGLVRSGLLIPAQADGAVSLLAQAYQNSPEMAAEMEDVFSAGADNTLQKSMLSGAIVTPLAATGAANEEAVKAALMSMTSLGKKTLAQKGEK